MVVHIVEGEKGCREAVEREAIAVVVDALRTSATIPWLFDLGASEVLAAQTLNEVHALRELHPDALLAGEMGGARIPGFDLGNSPAELRELDAGALRGRVVLFASSAGSRRLVEVRGAPEVYIGSTVNARRLALWVARRAEASGREVCLIAAGHPEKGIATPEDVWAAVYLASLLDLELSPEAQAVYGRHIDEVLASDLTRLFRTSPNAKRITKLGFGEDVDLAAGRNVCRSVPEAAGRLEIPGDGAGVRLRRADLDELWVALHTGG